MWKSIGQFILRFRWPLLIIVVALSGFMAYEATKVELSYEFSRAIPTDNAKYKAYQDFKKKFGEDGNLLVVGLQTPDLFSEKIFNEYAVLQRNLKRANKVEDIISIPSAINLVKDSASEKLRAQNIFGDSTLSQAEIDSCKNVFLSLPFYRGLLYNPQSNAWLMGVRINKEVLNSKKRNDVVANVVSIVNDFGKKTNLEVYLSGLPLVRTIMTTRIANEMR